MNKNSNSAASTSENSVPSNELSVSNTFVKTDTLASVLTTALEKYEMQKTAHYHIRIAEVKKKLNDIYQEMENLLLSSTTLNNTIDTLYADFSAVNQQLMALALEYDEQLVSFDMALNFYGIEDKNVLYDPVFLASFLESYSDVYLESMDLSAPEKKKEKANIKNSMYKTINELAAIDNTIDVKQGVIKKTEERQASIKKNIDDLATQSLVLQKKIIAIQKSYDVVYNQGLLKSYEDCDFTFSLDNFVASPDVEKKIKSIIALYKHPEIAVRHNFPVPKSILLLGNADTGKTHAAKVLASELGRKMYHINSYDLLTEEFQGPKPLYIFDLIIEEAQNKKEPSIIFLDNLEKIVDISRTLESVLMKHLSNIQKADLDIIVVAALGERQKISTPDIINHSMFPAQISFSLPKQEEKKRLLSVYIKELGKEFFSELSIEDLLQETNKINHNLSAQHLKRFVAGGKAFCVSQMIALGNDSYSLTLDDVRSLVSTIRQEDKQMGKLKYFE